MIVGSTSVTLSPLQWTLNVLDAHDRSVELFRELVLLSVVVVMSSDAKAS